MVQISSQDLITGLRKMDEAFGLKTGQIEQMMIDLRYKEVLPAIKEAEETVKKVDKLVKESKVNKQSISNIQSAIEQAKIGANTAMARAQELLKDINHINDKWDAHDKELLELMNNLNSLTAEQRQQATELMQKQQDLLKNVNTINDKWADSDRVINEQRQKLDQWATELTNAKTNLQSLHDNLNDTAKELSALTDQAKQQGSTLILVQQNMDGIKQSVADVKGNVTSLSQRADLLQATVTDQAKSISQVSLKADGLSSQVSTLNDKANQQAQSISQFNQTATSLQGQVASLTDASGKQAQQISEMKLDAEGVHTAVSELSETVSVNIAKDNMPDWVKVAGSQTIGRVPVKPNTQYSVSIDIQVTKPLAGHAVSVYFYECDGSNKRGTLRMANKDSSVTTVQTETLTFTAESTTTNLEVYWIRSSPEIEANIRHLMINEGATVKPYTSNTYSFKDMATFDQTAKSLTATVANNTGDLATLKQTATELRSDITNANGDITTLKTRANGFDALIGTKASQADLNDAKKLINDNSLSINATKNALQVKADQTTVDRVKNQVDTVSAQQTIQANQIAQRVTQSTLTNTLNGYATQDYVSSQIKTSANAINLNVTALSNKVNDNRGGVNLLTAPTNYTWVTNNKSYDIVNRVIAGSGGRKIVTVSFDLKATSRVPVKAFWYGGDDSTTKTTTNYGTESDGPDGMVTDIFAEPVTKRVVITWEYSDATDKTLLLGRVDAGVSNNVTISIENIMLEYGSVAHPYQLAPADQATTKQITDLNVDLNGVKSTVATQGQAISEFNQRATGLEGRVIDNKNNIDSLKITADGLRNQVGTFVPKSDLENTNKKINDLSTLITQTKSAVDIKANQTDVDRLKQSVNDANAKISVQANQITNLVTKSDLTTATNGMATQNWVQNQVKQTADQWNLNLTTLEAKTNESLQGAGVNLQNGTTTGAPQSTGSGSNGAAEWTYQRYTFYDQFRYDFETGKTYTISFDIICNSTPPSGLVVDTNLYAVKGNTSEWTGSIWASGGAGKPVTQGRHTYSITFKADKNYTKWGLYRKPSSDTTLLTATNVKVELGSVATPWTPAPSDTATVKSVTDLTVAVDGIKGTVKDVQNNVSTEVTQLSNALQQKISSDQFESRISQLDNDWNVRVTDKTNGKNLMNEINVSAGRTLFNGGKVVINGDTIISGGTAWIDSAMIASLAADKIYFPNASGKPAYMSAQVGALDPNAPAGTLSTRYQTGYEVTANDRAAFLMLNQKELRLAFRAKSVVSDNFYGMAATSDQAYFIAEGAGLFVKPSNPNGNSDSQGRAILSTSSGSAGIVLDSNSFYDTTSGGKSYHQGVIEIGKINDLWKTATVVTGWEQLRVNVHGWMNVDGTVEALFHTQHSTLSSKTNIVPMNPKDGYDLINETDLTYFTYKSEAQRGDNYRHIGPVIDDVNEIPKYNTPPEFVAPMGNSRDDDNIIGALMGAVQYLSKKVEALENNG